MVNFHGGSGQFAAIFYAPGERIQPRVNRAGRAAAIVKVHCAQPDDGAERALPGEARKREREVRVVLKFHSRRARRGLKLIHGQLTEWNFRTTRTSRSLFRATPGS